MDPTKINQNSIQIIPEISRNHCPLFPSNINIPKYQATHQLRIKTTCT